jgi:hypothetical protein
LLSLWFDIGSQFCEVVFVVLDEFIVTIEDFFRKVGCFEFLLGCDLCIVNPTPAFP